MSRFMKPLIALLLGGLPFFLFIGSTSTTVVNGELVAESRFNLGGVILALIGIGLAWSVLRERGERLGARKALAGLAALVCVVQLVSATDIYRIAPMDWLMPDRHLPAPQYGGLTEQERIVLLPPSDGNYRRTLASNKARIISNARLHRAYADLCHGGRSRIDLARAEAVPESFDADLRQAIDADLRDQPTPECSARQSARIIAALADETNRDMDLFDGLVEDYRSTSQTGQ